MEYDEDIRFVSLDVEKNHPWIDKRVMDLPPGLILAVIQRKGDVVVPRGSTLIREGDQIVLGAEGYHDHVGITLKELVLREHHPWTGCMIKQLDISRQTLIVMVRRSGKVLIPNGSLKLQATEFIVSDSFYLFSQYS